MTPADLQGIVKGGSRGFIGQAALFARGTSPQF